MSSQMGLTSSEMHKRSSTRKTNCCCYKRSPNISLCTRSPSVLGGRSCGIMHWITAPQLSRGWRTLWGWLPTQIIHPANVLCAIQLIWTNQLWPNMSSPTTQKVTTPGALYLTLWLPWTPPSSVMCYASYISQHPQFSSEHSGDWGSRQTVCQIYFWAARIYLTWSFYDML